MSADMRPLSEVRVLMYRGWPLRVEIAEGYWTDLDTYRRNGWSYFILIDDLELEYWHSVKGI